MYPFQWKAIKAARFLRDYGRKVIEQRIKDMQEGRDTPNDILQHIVLMIKSNTAVTMEELIDDFVTFFIAGIIAYTNKHFNKPDTSLKQTPYIGWSLRNCHCFTA